jgi:hypothetical protein
VKKILSCILLATALSAQAVVISDFSAAPAGDQFSGGLGSWTNGVDQFTTAAGILTVGPVSGGNPDNSGYFSYADLNGSVVFDATGMTQLTVVARLDSGNAAQGFIINLYDSGGNGALTATFGTTNYTLGSFGSWTETLIAHTEAGDISDIQYFGIAGSGTGAVFRISFDNISLAAIPEPSTYAAIAGALALGFVALRRRRAARA